MSFHQLFNHGHGRSFVIHRWVFFYSDLSPEGFAMSYRAEGLSATKRDHLSDPWKRSWQILSPGFPWLYWNPSETTPWLRKGLQVSSEEADEYMRKNGGSDATVWFFVVGYDFGNQECSVNTHSSIPGLHVLAWFQHVDSINGYLKYTPFSIFYAIVWGWKFLFSPHQNLSVPSYPKLYLRSSS